MKSKLFFSIATGLSGAAALAAQNTERPNIILFMVDDMGWQDSSVPFHSDTTLLNRRYHTPNMQRLADMGTRFSSAYACSISSPTRCSLMTGMNQARHRVTNWTFELNTSTDEPNPNLIMPDWNYNGIQPDSSVNNSATGTSFVQLLHDAGYHTIHVGKAHFGATHTPAENPLNYGFDVNIAGHAGGGPASYLGERCFGYNPDGTKWHEKFAVPGLEKYWQTDTFLTEALTLEAINALDSARTLSQPFYLYLAHYAIHVPLDKDSRFYDRYRSEGLDDTEARYAALIEGMDKSLGDILDYLTEHDMLRNTIVIFMSDNGGLCYQGSRGEVPGGRHNAPLRGGKGSVYEGGTREPMIVYWPGHTTPGTTVNDYLIIEDFFPSILEMAGIDNYSVPQTVDGKSFVPLINSSSDTVTQTRALVWNTPHTWLPVSFEQHGQGYGQTCAIRRGDYKLVYFYSDGKKELYNLADDIGENHNLASAMPDMVGELSRMLGLYLRSVDAQRPSFRDTMKPCPWPDEPWPQR